MIEREREMDIVTAFEQRFGTLALDIADLANTEFDQLPVFINGFPALEKLATFEADLALSLAVDADIEIAREYAGRAVNISGKGFESIKQFFQDAEVDPFAIVVGQKTQPTATDTQCINTRYSLGFTATNPVNNASIFMTSQNELLYYVGAKFSLSIAGSYQVRPGISSILDALEKYKSKYQ